MCAPSSLGDRLCIENAFVGQLRRLVAVDRVEIWRLEDTAINLHCLQREPNLRAMRYHYDWQKCESALNQDTHFVYSDTSYFKRPDVTPEEMRGATTPSILETQKVRV